MSERDDSVYVQDILASIDAIFQYISDVSEPEFRNNQMLQDAVIRRFEIMGEAASHISPEFRALQPDIEWRLMSDMRNKLIHEYFGVSSITIYHTVVHDLPLLKRKLETLL
ncbi:MAG: DUF86 domain-containing protein [Bacteroidetes bacterium]|nr:DUF86 domain-containing protein [Bacteroidota bacterium]